MNHTPLGFSLFLSSSFGRGYTCDDDGLLTPCIHNLQVDLRCIYIYATATITYIT